MKVENKPANIPQNETIKDYFGLLNICLDFPPSGGFYPSEMVRRYRISDKLIGGEVEFDFGEIEKIKECVRATAWAFRSKGIVEFTDYIEKL